MSHDEHARRLDDIEKRLARLERAAEQKPVSVGGQFTRAMTISTLQWCECGRDLCRAPDCPSHKSDPLGR